MPSARQALIRARGLSSDDPVVLNNLGISTLLDGHADEAASLFRQALASSSLQPAHTGRIKRNLAVTLATLGDFDEADRLAGRPMPRTLKNASPRALARFMGLGGSSLAEAAAASWSAQLAEAPRESAPRPR